MLLLLMLVKMLLFFSLFFRLFIIIIIVVAGFVLNREIILSSSYNSVWILSMGRTLTFENHFIQSIMEKRRKKRVAIDIWAKRLSTKKWNGKATRKLCNIYGDVMWFCMSANHRYAYRTRICTIYTMEMKTLTVIHSRHQLIYYFLYVGEQC